MYIGIPSDVFDSAFVDCIGNTEVQRFLSIALLQQKKNRQFLHFKPQEGHVEGGRLMEQLLREIVDHKVGYQSMGHFYQLFTDRYGMTPAKYRKQLNATNS